MTAIDYYSKGIVTPEHYFEWDQVHNYSLLIPDFIITTSKTNSPIRTSLQGGTLVDLGCGPGTSIPLLLDTFSFKKCIGVDGAEPMLSFLEERKFLYPTDLEVQRRNLNEDEIGVDASSAELVICCNAMKYLHTIVNVFSETSRMLKKHGLFGFNAYVFKHLGIDLVPEMHYQKPTIFKYAEEHIQELCKKFSLNIIASESTHCGLDEEMNVDLYEKLFILQKV